MSPRIALVTGAGNARGIGRAIALRLADDGLDVAVSDLASREADLLRVVDEVKAKGRRSIAYKCDVSSAVEVKKLVEDVANDFGGLDVMVANAGVFLVKPLLDMSVDEWERVMAINARGTLLQYKYAAKQMIAQGRGGRIIGASSVGGKRGHLNASAYSASKFAVRGLTQAAAQEFAKYKITVNAYAPGLIDTDIFAQPGTTERPIFEAFSQVTPYAGPEVVANHVSYLAQEATFFVTGQTTSICGGVHFD